MKTLKSIKTEKRLSNTEFLDMIKSFSLCAGEPLLVGKKSQQRIIFPDTQAGSYVLSVKCSKKINVYLGEYVAANPKRPVFEGFYADMTYWGDFGKRKEIYEKIEQLTEEIKNLLGI